MLTSEAVGQVIMQEIEALLLEDTDTAEGRAGSITGDRHLHELDINSLTLARLLIQLENQLGVDPFIQGVTAVSDVRSVNDLINAYHSALAT